MKRLKGYRPISYVHDGLILIRGANLYHADFSLVNVKHIVKLPFRSKLLYKFARFNFFSRLLRLNNISGLLLEKNKLLLKSKFGFYLCDLKNKKIVKESVDVRGNPFYLLKSNLRKSVLVGDYTSNVNKSPCSIYERSTNGSWNKLYSFPEGSINHIHSIYEDNEENCFYILTGDFGKASSIWKADLEFKNIQIYSHHGQSTRACWLIYDKNYFYYVSDQQDQINYFYRLKKNSKFNPAPEPIFPVNGPSINMTLLNNSNILFSTVVEPISVEKYSLKSNFDSKLPNGVLSKNIFLYYGNIKKGFKIIYRSKKDFLPPRLFQFGDIYFPTGLNKSSYLHFYEQASEKDGISTIALSLSNLIK